MMLQIWRRLFLVQFILLLVSIEVRAIYPKSYLESRTHFRKKAAELKAHFPSAQSNRLIVEEIDDFELTIDTLYLPALLRTEKLIIISTGIHGIEANAGAAVLFAFMEQLPVDVLQNTGFLFVHSVNPYGHAFGRRVSSGNVDLNRNLGAGPELYQTIPEGYRELESFLNPQTELNASLWQDLQLFGKSLWQLVRVGKKQITQAVVGGQYARVKGIYFGGLRPEPQVALLANEWRRVAEPYSSVLHLDIHTGYGQRGQLHFFAEGKLARLPGFGDLFADYKLDYGEDKDFYTTTGSFAEFTIKTLANKQVIPMTLEFGTLDSQTILGGFYSLRNMIYENQGHHHGFVNANSKERTEKLFRNMFDPQEPEWRQAALKQGREALLNLSHKFARLPITQDPQ